MPTHSRRDRCDIASVLRRYTRVVWCLLPASDRNRAVAVQAQVSFCPCSGQHQHAFQHCITPQPTLTRVHCPQDRRSRLVSRGKVPPRAAEIGDARFSVLFDACLRFSERVGWQILIEVHRLKAVEGRRHPPRRTLMKASSGARVPAELSSGNQDIAKHLSRRQVQPGGAQGLDNAHQHAEGGRQISCTDSTHEPLRALHCLSPQSRSTMHRCQPPVPGEWRQRTDRLGISAPQSVGVLDTRRFDSSNACCACDGV